MKSEINLAHIHLETSLVLSEDYVQLLIVENPNEFYNMVCDLERQMEGEEGFFVFSRENQIISASKCGVIVSDYFHLELNDKKILNSLYKNLETIAFGEKLACFNELNTRTAVFLSELSFCTPFLLDYEDPQPIDYLKAAGVKFAKTYDSLEEKIICYINAFIELKKCDFFIFVNLKSVLSDKELLQIYAHCQAEQVGLLLMEDSKRRPLLSCERAVIITEDLCEILENYEDLY